MLVLGTTKFQSFLPNNMGTNGGGFVYTYQAGTSPSPSNYLQSFPTVQDALNYSNPNTNPVQLDGDGMANIVLNGATLVVVRDKDGNLLYSVDNLDLSTTSDVYDIYGNLIVQYTGYPSSVNYFRIRNSQSGQALVLTAFGADTNIGIDIMAKGSGRIGLSTSGTVAIQNHATTGGNLTVGGNLTTNGSLTANGISYPSTAGSEDWVMTRTSANTLAMARSMTAVMAFATGTVTVANNTETPVAYGAEQFDRGNWFNGSDFTPTKPGIYCINFGVGFTTSTSSSGMYLRLYKNSSIYRELNIGIGGGGGFAGGNLSGVLVSMNGTTDSVNTTVLQATGTTRTISNPATWFSAYRVEVGL